MLRIGRLDGVVELVAQREFELTEPSLDIVNLTPLGPLSRLPGQIPQDVEIALGDVEGVRPLHLDDDGGAVGKLGGVDLTDRGRRDGLCRKRSKKLVRRSAELCFHDFRHVVVGHGRRIVLELRELLDIIRGQDVGPSTEHLPELDERGAEILEGGAEVLRTCRGAPLPPQPTKRKQAAEPKLEHEPAEPVTCQHRQDLPEPATILPIGDPELQDAVI